MCVYVSTKGNSIYSLNNLMNRENKFIKNANNE